MSKRAQHLQDPRHRRAGGSLNVGISYLPSR